VHAGMKKNVFYNIDGRLKICIFNKSSGLVMQELFFKNPFAIYKKKQRIQRGYCSQHLPPADGPSV